MFTKTLAALGGALILVAVGGGTAHAQTTGAGGESVSNPGAGISQSTATGDDINAPSRNATPSRVPRERRVRQGASEAAQAAQAGAPVAPDFTALAQTHLTASGVSCQVTEAVSPGVTLEQTPIYEAACASGPGYVVIASTPAQAYNCLELAGTAATARARDPNADVGQQCALPANQNGLAVIGGWARDAGVTCTVDEAIAIGKNAQNEVVYEVGCAAADGYWLEKAGEGWKLQDCLQIASVGGTCRFTTAQEQADAFETKLAGTDAAACDVAQVRLMGSNANGRFYETKCAAAGEGYVARLNAEGVTQQIYPCATAQRIGGGCTLTPAPAVAPVEAPATE